MKKWLPLIVVGALLLGTAYFWLEPLWSFLSDRGKIEVFLLSIGSWGPLGLIVLQALQISFFPIPSFFGMIGGFLFGFFPGLIYTQIGTFLGSLLAFFLTSLLTIGQKAGCSKDPGDSGWNCPEERNYLFPYILLAAFPS